MSSAAPAPNTTAAIEALQKKPVRAAASEATERVFIAHPVGTLFHHILAPIVVVYGKHETRMARRAATHIGLLEHSLRCGHGGGSHTAFQRSHRYTPPAAGSSGDTWLTSLLSIAQVSNVPPRSDKFVVGSFVHSAKKHLIRAAIAKWRIADPARACALAVAVAFDSAPHLHSEPTVIVFGYHHHPGVSFSVDPEALRVKDPRGDWVPVRAAVKSSAFPHAIVCIA